MGKWTKNSNNKQMLIFWTLFVNVLDGNINFGNHNNWVLRNNEVLPQLASDHFQKPFEQKSTCFTSRKGFWEINS